MEVQSSVVSASPAPGLRAFQTIHHSETKYGINLKLINGNDPATRTIFFHFITSRLLHLENADYMFRRYCPPTLNSASLI